MNMQMRAVLIRELRRCRLNFGERGNVFAAFLKTPYLFFKSSLFQNAHEAAAHVSGFPKGATNLQATRLRNTHRS